MDTSTTSANNAAPLSQHPTRSEIIQLAVAEGHDADIPSNLGSVAREPSQPDLRDAVGSLDLGNESEMKKTDLSHPSRSLSEASISVDPRHYEDHVHEKEVADDEFGLEEMARRARSRRSVEKANGEEHVGGTQDDSENEVWWDGPDDPANPMNWKPWKRWGAIYLVSVFTFLTPFASSVFAPGVPELMEEFNSNSSMLEAFVVSVYVLGLVFGPLIIAPLSEIYGRIPVYHTCNLLFVVFSIACAVANNMPSFIIFRFFEGVFGACPMALGGGTIADVTTKDERATAMSAWMMGPTAGPAIGPVVGGFLSQAKGWRWNFWLVAIAGGAFGVAAVVLLDETYAPTILERKAKRLRKETINPHLKSRLDNGLSPRDLFIFSIVRPSKMLVLSPIVFVISLYLAICYSYLYLMFTTLTPLFISIYGFGRGVVGLSYLGLGMGCVISQFYCTWISNRVYRRAMRNGTVTPEVRLQYTMIQGSVLLPIGLFWYGWSADAGVHWIVPILGTGVVGFAMVLCFLPASTYLIDCFTVYAASAMAAATVLRSLFGALIPLAGQTMYDKLGLGWGNSVLAFVAVAFAPTPLLFIKFGPWLRTKFKVNL